MNLKIISTVIKSLEKDYGLAKEQIEKDDIHEALIYMKNAQDVYNKDLIKKSCKHLNIIRYSETSDMAKCAECEELMQPWYCKSSPDKLCHYYTNVNGKDCYIELINGDIHYLKNHRLVDRDHENEDVCLFCGNPEERK